MRFILIWIKPKKIPPMYYREPVKTRLPSSAIIELIFIRIDVILVQLLYTHINTHTPVSCRRLLVGGWRGGFRKH